jgi:hypothetical protein
MSGDQGKALGAEGIRSKAMELRRKAEEMQKSKAGVEATLGVGELTTVTDQILGHIFNRVDRILNIVAEKVVPLLEIIADVTEDPMGWILGNKSVMRPKEKTAAEYTPEQLKKFNVENWEKSGHNMAKMREMMTIENNIYFDNVKTETQKVRAGGNR